MAIITENQLRYICRNMLGLDSWLPEMHKVEHILEVLKLCQSTLEIMYLIGAYHFIEQTAKQAGHGVSGLSYAEIEYNKKKYPAVWFVEPWAGWYTDWASDWSGPSSMAFVPQIEIAGLHFDFGIFCGHDNGSSKGSLWYVVEIDGYGVHKDRRELDNKRDEILESEGLTFLRLREELDNPLMWFEKVVRLSTMSREEVDDDDDILECDSTVEF
jgi:hypothetical protein